MAEWIIPCDLKQYNIIDAFKALDRIDWKQNNEYQVGDHVYIYVSRPESAIRYLCAVTKTDKDTRNMSDKAFIKDGSKFLSIGRYMELTKVAEFHTPLLHLYALEENGLKSNIQGPMKISDPVLASYIYASSTTRLEQKPGRGPDPDHTLKEIVRILLHAYHRRVPRRYLTKIIYPIGIPNHSANLTNPIQQLEKNNEIIRFTDHTLQIKNTEEPNYFYVFQNKTFEKESKQGYLIANKEKNGIHRAYWDNMQLVKKGDVIFHSKDQYCVAVSIAKTDATTKDKDDNGRESWFVRTDYYLFPHPIRPKDYWEHIKPLRQAKHAPFDKNGNGNFGYLFQISKEMADVFLRATAGELPARRAGEPVEVPEMDEDEKNLFKHAEDILQDELEEDPMENLDEAFEYNGKPKLREEKVEMGGRLTYPRDPAISKNALAHAHFKCEIDPDHFTFIRKNSDKPFTEAHHLVPMSYSDSFGVSLDVEENVVSLCCTCHRNIHHGRDREDLIRKLYDERKEVLYKAGISLSIEDLLKMY